MLCWLDNAHYLHSQGFRVFYSSSSHIKTFQLMSTHGGFRTGKIQTKENGNDITLGFLRWPMNPIMYNNHIS